jgi:Rrf2 family protein
MLVSMQADYALRVLVDVAMNQGSGTPVVTREIAERQRIPRVFLTKIVAQLASQGMLHTQRGKGGGVSLNVDPESINILAVIEAFEGHLMFNQCVADPAYCSLSHQCTVRVLWEEAEQHLTRFFGGLTLGDILERIRAANALGSGPVKLQLEMRERPSAPARAR